MYNYSEVIVESFTRKYEVTIFLFFKKCIKKLKHIVDEFKNE
jgi:hypothetical protein